MPTTHVAGSRLAAPETMDDLVLYRVSRLLATAGGMVVRYCEGRFGITRREWRILAQLAARGPMGSSELATHAQLDRPRTSKAVTALAAKKLVSRTARAGDARHVVLALTEAGEALHRELFPLASQVNRDVLDVLTKQEVELLDGLLARMQSRAQDMAAQGGLPLADRRSGGTGRLRGRGG